MQPPSSPESRSGEQKSIPASKKLALVADDQESVRYILGLILNSHGFEVAVASDGIEAVEFVREYVEKIDIVFLDLGMPGLGGADAFRQMRKLKADLQVVIMTGRTLAEIREHLGDIDAQIIQKPFDRDAFDSILQGMFG